MNQRLKQAILDLTPPMLMRAINRYLEAKRVPRAEKIVEVYTVEELETWIQKAEQAGAISDDAFRQVLASFRFVSRQPLPKDPFSAAYRDAQQELYKMISGRPGYQAAENEMSYFDLEAAQHCPFPYCTHSFATAGEHVAMQGILLRMIKHSPLSANVLEFGAGWGNLTLTLAQLGCQVTAVDINPRFLDLIAFRAKLLGQNIKLVCQDMLQFTSDEKYDVIVFFESFHHCWDHGTMLSRLHNWLKEDGVVVFGGEGIIEMEAPWGVRLDGLATWSIRRCGWFELGFSPNYFMAALEQHGWQGELYRSVDVPCYSVVIAQRQQVEVS